MGGESHNEQDISKLVSEADQLKDEKISYAESYLQGDPLEHHAQAEEDVLGESHNEQDISTSVSEADHLKDEKISYAEFVSYLSRRTISFEKVPSLKLKEETVSPKKQNCTIILETCLRPIVYWHAVAQLVGLSKKKLWRK